jgi:hypothetical protein
MANYAPYPNKKTLASRKTRKSVRNKIFWENRQAVRKLKSLRAQKRQEQLES